MRKQADRPCTNHPQFARKAAPPQTLAPPQRALGALRRGAQTLRIPFPRTLCVLDREVATLILKSEFIISGSEVNLWESVVRLLSPSARTLECKPQLKTGSGRRWEVIPDPSPK